MDQRLSRWRDDNGQLWQICQSCTDPTREEDLAIDPVDGKRWDLCARCGEEQFNRLTNAFIRHLMPQIPKRYRSGFETMIAGGEYAMAINDIVDLMEDHQIELSLMDTQTLRALNERRA